MRTEQLALKAALGYVERNTPHLVRDEIRTLVSERDELASRVRELEGALLYCKHEAGVPERVWKAARAALNASKEQP